MVGGPVIACEVFSREKDGKKIAIHVLVIKKARDFFLYSIGKRVYCETIKKKIKIIA